MFKYYSLVMALFLSWATGSQAKPWFFIPNSADQLKINDLKSEFLDIGSMQELQKLMKRIELMLPVSEVLVTEAEDGYKIEIVEGEYVNKIVVTGINSLLTKKIELRLTKILGNIANTFFDKRFIKRETREILNDSGYYNVRLQITMVKLNPGIEYDVEIQVGPPCVIRQVYYNNQLSPDNLFGISAGSICDESAIQSNFDRYIRTIEAQGFVEHTLAIKTFKYDHKRNDMKVFVAGEKNQAIEFKFENEKSIGLVSKVLFGDVLSDINSSTFEVDGVQSEVVRRFRNAGCLDVVVENPKQSRKEDSEKVIYTFDIEQGQRYKVSGVDVVGNKFISTKEIADQFIVASSWYDSYLNQEKLADSLGKLEQFYLESGFWDVQIEGFQFDKQADQSVRIRINITENKQHLFGRLRINNSAIFSKGRIEKLLDLYRGRPIAEKSIIRFQSIVNDELIAGGYLYAKVDLSINKTDEDDKSIVDLTITMDEGVRVKVGKIFIRGLTKTKEQVVRRELTFKSNEWYEVSNIDETRRALSRLSIFRRVLIEFADQKAYDDKSDRLDLVVKLSEGRPGSVSFAPGWSRIKGTRFSVESAYLNLFGSGRQVFAKASLSEERNQKAIKNETLMGRRFTVGYLEPWLFAKPIDLKLLLNYQATADDFWSIGYVGEVSLNYSFEIRKYPGQFSLFLREKFSEEVQTEIQKQFLISTDKTLISSVGVRFNLDTRDERSFPSKGFFVKAQLSLADGFFGGDFKYYNWEASVNTYFKVYKDLVFALSVSSTNFMDVDKIDSNLDILPSNERLFAGGSDSFRGVRDRTIGPYTNTRTINEDGKVSSGREVVGGSQRNIIKAEMRYRFIKPAAFFLFTDFTRLAFSKTEVDAFNDRLASIAPNEGLVLENNINFNAGDLFEKPLDYYYASSGLGFSFLTPLGSLRWSFGIPWNKPQSTRCSEQNIGCDKAVSTNDDWYRRGRGHINFGVNF